MELNTRFNDCKERLVFDFSRNAWRLEKLTSDDRILDFQELVSSGVASRFDLDQVKESLAVALAGLEAVVDVLAGQSES